MQNTSHDKLKYIFMLNSEMSRFCAKNLNFAQIFGQELTINFPELFNNKNDKKFESLMKTCIDKSGNIIPALYYKNMNNILQSFGLNALYCILLFTNDFHFIGFADVGFINDSITVTISNFFVQKDYRGKYYGTLLMKIIINKLKTSHSYIKKIILDVDTNNVYANKLYCKLGFAAIGNSNVKKQRMILLLS